MSRDEAINVDHGFFSAEQNNDVLILKFKEDLLLRATDLNARDLFFNYLDTVSKYDSIKSIVIVGYSEKKGCQEYMDFLYYALISQRDRWAQNKLFNVAAQYILKLVDLDKIVIHADSGCIIPLFMNISLACDYRLIADNTVFETPYIELGLTPTGGGPFFLRKMLGKRKALQLLLADKALTADEALKLGIVDKVVPIDELEDAALEVARNFGKHHRRTLKTIKKLLNYPQDELKDYLEIETQELQKIVGSMDFYSELKEKFES